MISIASYNGPAAVRRAVELMREGRSPLDACVEGVTLVEDDPNELTVGSTGLPNAEGVVELDAAVMDGPTHRGAAVAALRDVRHPTRVARALYEQTNRVLLAGEGAKQFALAAGFPEEDLLTDKARRIWHYWRRARGQLDDWNRPEADELPPDEAAWLTKHLDRLTGTVHCAALDDGGHLACATSTSGHAFKMPGRVGDSPILGAGLYVDNEAGTCGSIGHGELNQQHLSSFCAVESMRSGASPVDAGLATLERIVEKIAPNGGLRDRSRFNLQLFLLAADGTHAGVALRGPKQYAVADENGSRLMDCVCLTDRPLSQTR